MTISLLQTDASPLRFLDRVVCESTPRSVECDNQLSNEWVVVGDKGDFAIEKVAEIARYFEDVEQSPSEAMWGRLSLRLSADVGSFGIEDIDFLAETASDVGNLKDRNKAETVAYLLGEVGREYEEHRKRATKALQSMLAHWSADVKVAAVNALSQIGGTLVEKILQDVARDDRSPQVKEAAEEALLVL